MAELDASVIPFPDCLADVQELSTSDLYELLEYLGPIVGLMALELCDREQFKLVPDWVWAGLHNKPIFRPESSQ